MPEPHRGRRVMVAVVVVATTALLTIDGSSASAHTDGEASTPHVLLELARYGVAVAVVLGAMFAVFWLRARAMGRRGR